MWRLLALVVVAGASIPAPVAAQSRSVGAEGREGQIEIRIPGLPGDATFPRRGGLNPDLDLRFDMSNWARKREQVIMPLDPQEASDDIATLARLSTIDCNGGRNPFACGRAERFTRASNRLGAAASAAPTCEQAADDFRRDYRDGTPSSAVANAYDIACLGSFTARKDKAGAPVRAPRPAMLADADKPNDLLTAVGLLELDGKIVCAGLIRPDRKFMTARHCVRLTGTDGFTVLSASGKVQGIGLKVTNTAPWSKIGVAADWAVIDLPAAGGLPIARTNIVALDAPAEVTVIAAYPYADQTDYVTADPMPLRALRYPRDGMCQALVAYNGCLQLACQTVRGFSGAPIFSSRKPDGSYDVVGLVSGSEGNDAKCSGTEQVANSTFAVSASAFGL